MSSFIIGKGEYIKAAGLLYGVCEASKPDHENFLKNIRTNMVTCYCLNVLSYNAQYGENEKLDKEKYDEDFKRCRIRGWAITNGTDKEYDIGMLRACMMQFFRSVLYQIEEKPFYDAAAAIFFECMKILTEEISGSGWWGEIEL